MKNFSLILILIAIATGLSACSLEVAVENLDGANYSSSTLEAVGPFIADGITPATLKIWVRDKGKPVIGYTPIYKVSGSGNLLGQCSETDSAGLSVCLLRSTSAGSKTISLVKPESTAQTQVVFVPGLPAKAGFSLSSGGGIRTTGDIKSISSIGLVSSSVLLDDGYVTRARVGLQGVLYDGY